METEAPAEWGEYKKGTDYKASPAWVMEIATMAAEGSGLYVPTCNTNSSQEWGKTTKHFQTLNAIKFEGYDAV